MGKAHPLLVHLAVGDDPVDHAPALELRGLVEPAGHHELARPSGPGPLGDPLRPAGARRQPDHRLDEAEARGLLGPDHVAAERHLEPGREAEALDQGEGRDLERLEPANGVDQRLRELARPLRTGGHDALELVHVDAPGEDLPLSAPDERPRVGARDLLDAGDELVERALAEEVERRVGEDELRDVAVALEPDHAPVPRIRSATAAICSGSEPRGIHGSFNGSSS